MLFDWVLIWAGCFHQESSYYKSGRVLLISGTLTGCLLSVFCPLHILPTEDSNRHIEITIEIERTSFYDITFVFWTVASILPVSTLSRANALQAYQNARAKALCKSAIFTNWLLEERSETLHGNPYFNSLSKDTTYSSQLLVRCYPVQNKGGRPLPLLSYSSWKQTLIVSIKGRLNFFYTSRLR